MNEGRKQINEEVRMLDMLLELIDTKLKSLFAERELMQRFYYDKQIDYEMTKEITDYQKLRNYVEEWKAAIIAIADEVGK